VPRPDRKAESGFRQGFQALSGELHETLMERLERSFFGHLFKRLSQKSTSAPLAVDEKKPGEPGCKGMTIKSGQKA